MSNDLTSITNPKEFEETIDPSDKVIVYTIETKAEKLRFNVIVNYDELNKIVRELRENCQYEVIGSSERKGTYLEYILSNFVKAIDDEAFRIFRCITHSEDSNNTINTIINYENSGELDTEDERKARRKPLESLSKYKRDFDLEILRGLYDRVKKCIGFRLTTRTESEIDDGFDFEKVQSYVKK